MGDEVRGGAEDVGGRAVVALQPDHLGAGEILLEAQDVVDLGAAPAIDRLVVVADAADVRRMSVFSLTRAACLPASRSAGACHRRGRPRPRAFGRSGASRLKGGACAAWRPPRQQAQPQVLRDVGVLVLVDQHVVEARVVVGEHVRVLAEEADRMSSSRSPKSTALSVFSRSW